MGIYLVMKNNLRRSMKHKILFLITLLLPVIVCCLFGLIRFDKVGLRIGILKAQNEVVRKEQEEFFLLLEQSEGITYAFAEEESSNTDLMMGRFHIILDYRNASSLEEVKILSLQSKERQILLQEAIMKMIKDKSPFNLTGYKDPGLSITERSIATILSLVMVFATIHASAYIRDRASGTMVRYQFSGFNRSGYLWGYFLHTLLITFVQGLLCITALTLLQTGFSISTMIALLIAAVIAVIGSVYAIIICALSKSEVSANILASSMVGIFSVLGGTFIAVESMPFLLRGLSLASPIKWVTWLLQVIG